MKVQHFGTSIALSIDHYDDKEVTKYKPEQQIRHARRIISYTGKYLLKVTEEVKSPCSFAVMPDLSNHLNPLL